VTELTKAEKSEILETLKRIEEKMDVGELKSRNQWAYSLGFGAMIGSVGLLSYNAWASAGVFIAGYFLMVYYGRNRKRKK